MLVALAGRLATVAVVSGRPVAYLEAQLGPLRGVGLAGLYGMEEVATDGRARRSAEAEVWRPAVEGAAGRLAASAPPGVEVEPKGLSVTVHWRRAPDAGAWAAGAAEREAATTGLALQAGRMAVELRPPVGADKGTVVARLAAGRSVVGYFGDDLGDLPAFAVLAELARSGVAVARVAVAGGDSPPAVAAAADLVLSGPEEAVAVLAALALP